MLRPSIKKRVLETLAKPDGLEVDDFVLAESEIDEGTATGLTIRYRFADGYLLEARIPHRKVNSGPNRTRMIDVEEQPGGVSQAESLQYNGFNRFLEGIAEWAGRVEEDITASPFTRMINRQAAEIEDLLAKVEQLPDEMFSRDEAEELRKRLGELEQQLSEHIARESEAGDDQEERLQGLKTDFELLKDSVDGLKKRGWAGTLVVRVSKWLRDPVTRDVLKSATDVVRRMLPGNGGS